MTKKLRIGTRASALAMIQTNMVVDALERHCPDVSCEIVKIETSGEWKPEQGEKPLSADRGGKGLFAREIEAALLDGRIDCGVHSLKDMPAILPEGLVIDHMLVRGDPRDAFLANSAKTIDDLPEGAVVGTAGPRRKAFLLNRRPDLEVQVLRGNVPTRIEKLRNGQVDAAILAVCGLKRLGLEQEIASVLEPEMMLPSAGQGTVAIEIRESDTEITALFDQIHCRETGLCAAAERAAVAALEGDCDSPIGAYAEIENGRLFLRVAYLSLDGRQKYEESVTAVAGDIPQAVECGRKAGLRLREMMQGPVP